MLRISGIRIGGVKRWRSFIQSFRWAFGKGNFMLRRGVSVACGDKSQVGVVFVTKKSR